MANQIPLVKKECGVRMSTGEEILESGESPCLQGDVTTQQLLKKMNDIPESVLKELITNQINLEIRLKHRELKLSQEEVAKVESQLLILRKFFEIPNDVKLEREPNEFTAKYFDLLNKSIAITYKNIKKVQNGERGESPISGPASPSPDTADDEVQRNMFNSNFVNNFQVPPAHRTRLTMSSLRPLAYNTPSPSSTPGSGIGYQQTSGCLYRRSDGIIVKLTCPDCQRTNFSSAQGFLNHSRIAHGKEYISQDAAALKCGEVLPIIEQDERGITSLQALEQRGLDANTNLNVPEINFDDSYRVGASVGNAEDKSGGSSPHSEVKGTGGITEEGLQLYKENQELMKQLIAKGVIKNLKEGENLIRETKTPVINLHLFDDEREIYEEINSPIQAKPQATHKPKTSWEVGTTQKEAKVMDTKDSSVGKTSGNAKRRHSGGDDTGGVGEAMDDADSIASAVAKRRKSRGGINIRMT